MCQPADCMPPLQTVFAQMRRSLLAPRSFDGTCAPFHGSWNLFQPAPLTIQHRTEIVPAIGPTSDQAWCRGERTKRIRTHTGTAGYCSRRDLATRRTTNGAIAGLTCGRGTAIKAPTPFPVSRLMIPGELQAPTAHSLFQSVQNQQVQRSHVYHKEC